jgi:cytochrome c oxidase assembly protein subunit 15
VAASGIYMQIVLGAQLRHPGLGRAPGWFTLWIWLHVILAGLLAVVVVGLLRLTARRCPDQPMLRRRSRWLLGLFALQLVLGAAAWITHYNWPVWFSDWFWKIEYTVVTGGRLQALLTTAHVAVGSLNLAVAASLALWWRRLAQASPKSSFP